VKIHLVTVIACELHDKGSCAIDKVLLDAVEICKYEHIHIHNINNANPFTTYAIRGRQAQHCLVQWRCYSQGRWLVVY